MKNLNLLFKLLLFPFLFALRSKFKDQFKTSNIFLVLLTLSLTIIPSLTYADSNPSDSCANPRSISLNGTANGHLVGNGSSPYEEDFFVFTVPADGTLRIWSTGYNDDLDAFLYDDNGCSNVVASDTRGAATTNNVDFTYTATAGTTYKLRIRGWRGNASYILHVDYTPDVPPNTCTGTHGLTGNYYNDSPRNNSFIPPIVLSRIDSDINFEWGSGNPGGGINNDDFSTEWTGTIYFPEDADYTFSLAHDDVMILTIDGSEIYNSTAWTGGSNNFRDASPVHFNAGTYPITIRFVEWGGGAYARLAWSNNGSIGSQIIVPNINFCTTVSTGSADLALSKPTPPSPLTANINEDIHFQPHLENLGPDNASADITLSITYSLDVTVGSVPTGYTCTVASGGALSAGTANICTSTSDIAASTAQDFLFTVQATESGSLTQAVTVSSTTNDPDATNNLIISDIVTISGFQAVDDSFSTSANMPLDENVFTNDIGIVSGVAISNVDTSTLQGSIISFDINTGDFTYDSPLNFTGTDTFTYTISDGTSESTATVQISVSTIAIDAVNDSFDTYPDVTLRDNILQNDTGLGITYTSHTAPSYGTIIIQSNGDFVYTPSGGYRGDDTFTYTITDLDNNTDTATVTITIGTAFTSGDTRPFELVNPDYSRNVIGDYKIAGNTVLCLTEKTTGYGGTCHGDSDYQSITSNMNVSKYLDIDNDNGTWNSTSSYIDLSGTPYDPTRGVVWAGLFWGGRISSSNTYPIRYYTENYPNAPTAVEVGDGGNVGGIDVSTIGTQNIKLKIDNGSYNNVISSTFHTSGQTYSAYADVSAVLQSASLTKDKHVFTVANLTTMEGREGSPGAFGGWALVVIYAETHEYGKPRNVSIYNGFIDIQEDDDPITISGFKLPTSGDVMAQLSVFSGEGEHLYGYRAGKHNKHDWMKISSDGTNYSYMPGLTAGDHVGNRDNSFNAQLDNILRDHIDGEYNDLGTNNVGVDIDNYDVSSLMTSYRDVDLNISEVKIKTSSDWDYITMSMIAFSAELYVPELCYDYTLDISGHVIPSVNNEIKTPFGSFGEPLTTALYLKSLEGDIDLTNVNVNYSVIDTAQVTYNECPGSITYVSETGEYDYSDACDYVHNSSSNGFGMYIGKYKTTSQGGTISAFEQRYIKFKSDFQDATIDTYFSFSVDYTVDYGSGAVPLHQIFTADDLCEPTSGGFLPELGTFNITDATSDYDEWNLYTQVSRRPFNLKLYAYAFDANDYLTPITNDLNLSVEVEVIRADNFNRDANTACNDQHSIMDGVPAKFLNFTPGANGKMVEFGYGADEFDFAYRSAAMRVWYLTDVGGNGTLVDNHNCTRVTQPECVKLYIDQYGQDTSCSAQCSLNNTSLGNCYECLRTNYGRKVCSRDNFAIRPESFITQIYDSNQSNLTTDPSNHIANSSSVPPVLPSEFSLVSGYNYRFDINATNHVDDIATPRYIQHFEPGSPTHYIHMNWWPDGHIVTGCNDVTDKNISLNIFNGSDVNPITNITYVDKVDQIGKYRFKVYDQNWTSADWDTNQMLHHSGDYAAYYNAGTDCEKDSSSVEAIAANDSRHGCAISSVHTNPDTNEVYDYLFPQYYPYEFDKSGLTVGARPTNDGANDTFVYINTPDLNVYPDGIDENMSYNIQGTFTAVGKDNGRLSNFVENCYAESVDMALYQNYNHPAPTQTAELSYDLINFDTVNGIESRARHNDIFSDTTDSTLPLIIDQDEEYFEQDMNGSLNMDLGYNYVRTMNTELNPRHMHMRDFNITYTTPPADIFADLETDHKIFGNIDLDQNITFVYGRAKPNKFFYDDVTAGSMLTPVSIVAYCDLGLLECQNRGLSVLATGMLTDAQSNESSWWYSQNHSTAVNNDGQVTLTASGGGTVAPVDAISINLTNGIDSTVLVTNTGGTPNIVDINLGSNTDRWLIYNKDANSIPSPFYRVRFIGSGTWSTTGNLPGVGHVVGDDINTKKAKRVEW